MGEDGTVPLGHNGEGEGTVVVLHHTVVIVPLRQGSLRLDVEAVGVTCTMQPPHINTRTHRQSSCTVLLHTESDCIP